jgi:hypothetical protein
VTKPVITIADNTLWVGGRGGTVDLGAKVTTTDSNDRVTVNITGLPKYETITDKRDGHTFRGSNITLTAAEVDSGLVLHSYYGGGGHPGAKLTLTASAKDPVSGAVKKAAPQTITVTDPTSYVTRPVLTIADHTLSVTGRGGKVGLGTRVTTTDHNDRVTVNITGLPKYETITDKRDGHTFRGNNITLTAAEVDSGLVLHSYYGGGGHPVAKLTLTASAKDPVTVAVKKAAPQTITVTDPPPAATTTTTSPHTTTVTNHPTSTSSGLAAGQSSDHVSSTVATTAPNPITVTDPASAAPTTTASPANQGFALFSQIRDLVANSGVATSAPHPITVADPAPATGTSTASLASQSFALLNQYLAGNAGRVDPGQIVAAVSNGTGWGQGSFLTRPQH